MQDYDVVVIGGGINGLTAAAYLAKAGKTVGVFEARGQCGAHCDTIELGLSGFLHNTHATWIVPALSPAMADLDLAGFGLDLHGTDVLFAKTFLDGRNVVQALDQTITGRSLERVSKRDADMQGRISQYLMEHAVEVLDLNQKLLFSAPTAALMTHMASFHDGLLQHAGLPLSGDDLQRMNGFEALEMVYESEAARTTTAALGEYTQQLPIHRRTGALAFTLGAMMPIPVHTARGGSHALTHALVKAVVAAGGDVWSTCPVDKILVRNGRAHGIRLSADAVFPREEIQAGVVVSNLSLVPTFLRLLGEDVVGVDRARQIRGFNYPLYLCRMLSAGLVKGGSHRLSSAMYRYFLRHGGAVIDQSEVVRIVTEGGRATGVEVAGGKRFEARAVVSTLNPEQTFRQLVGDAACPTDLRRSVQSWEWEERTMFGLHLGIRGEVAFTCAEPRVRDAMIVFCGLDTDQELLAHLHRIDAGEAGKCEWLHLTIPSLFDATMAPAGHHLLRAEAVVKYDASWSTGARAFGDSCLELIKRHATLGEIVLRRELTPLDIESKLSTMKRGSIKHGAYTSLQMGYLRPNLLCSQSETPIGGLFLGGASMYPGGMIIGGPGYIAANVVGAFLG